MGVMQHFSTNLENLRKEKGLTQKQLADELGVSRGTISFYEKAERTADIEFLVKVSDYFDVSVNYLLGKAQARSTNTSVDDICEYTGLNEESIRLLHGYLEISKTIDPEYASFPHIDFINFFISSKKLLPSILDYKQSLKRSSIGLKSILEDLENDVVVNNRYSIDTIDYVEYQHNRDSELDFYRTVKSFEKMLESYVEADVKEIDELSKKVESIKPSESSVYAFIKDIFEEIGETNANHNEEE